MPSFDIVSKVDVQSVDNAINIARKEFVNRFDFRDTKSTIELNKKDMLITITTENDMRLEALIDIIRQRMIKQNINPMCLDQSKDHYSSGMVIKKEIKIRQGIDKEVSRKIMADIKALKTKAIAQVMNDIIRVQSKSINELQTVIAACRKGEYDLPLQFENMK